MTGELSSDQAREIQRLRIRHPKAELVVHRRAWGVVIEARRGPFVLEIVRCGFDGTTSAAEELVA